MINSNLITIKNSRSPISEGFRILRTNIQFSSFDEKIRTIVVTSAGAGEGKSTVSSNLSVVLAESGKRTILIDCDQRKPKINKYFSLSNKYGLSNVLVEEVDFADVVNPSGIENLDILTAGTKPPNPSELLGSVKMREFIEGLKNQYEYIILDTPPVVIVTDAQILSQYSDGCILVVASGEADREAVIKAKLQLEKVNAKILGVVLNKMDVSSNKYTYYYGDDDEKKVKNKKKSLKKR